MRPFLVGLTGGLAAGKSTVAELLRKAGFSVWDADRLVAELYRPGQPGADAVATLFGAAMLAADGGVDHVRLGALAFADAAARRRLQDAIHPLVRQRFRELATAAGTAEVAVLEGTLLVEAGHGGDFDLLVSVESADARRRARAIARGLSPEDADRRLLAQGDGQARRAAAGWIVANDGDRDDLRREVELLIAEIRRRAAARRVRSTPPRAPG